MTRIAFSPKVLESHYQFEKYLESKEAIAAIREEAKKPYVPGQARLGAHSVAWLTATYPLRCYYTLFLSVVGNLLYYGSPLRKLGLYLYAEGKLQGYYASSLFDNYLFNSSNILVDCRNNFSHDAYEIYTQEPICLDAISIDRRVLKHMHKKCIDSKNRLHLSEWDGQCGGISNWVAYLYHKTKHDFKDPEHHLVSIVSQVRYGSTREAAVMHAAQRRGHLPLRLKEKLVSLLKYPTKEKVQKTFKCLRPGLYSLTMRENKADEANHVVNIAVTRSNFYLFDSNKGLIKDSLENLAKKVAKNYILLVDETCV